MIILTLILVLVGRRVRRRFGIDSFLQFGLELYVGRSEFPNHSFTITLSYNRKLSVPTLRNHNTTHAMQVFFVESVGEEVR
jgi:hypothetical protein